MITKIEIVSTAATRTSSLEKPRSPTWNAVSAWRSPSPTAILPNAVAEPVATTTARPEPWCTTVPMKAHDGRSEAMSVDDASTVLAAAIDSPVSTASSHSSWFASSRRRSAGTTSPTRKAHDIAGHEVAHVEALLGAVAPHQGLVADVGVQRGDGDLRAVLVDEAEPDAQHHDRGDDPAIGAVAGGGDTAAAASSRMSSGLRSWRARTPHTVTRRSDKTLGPNRPRRTVASSAVRPRSVEPKA